MGNAVGFIQPKDEISSVATNTAQLDRVVKHGLLSDGDKQLILDAIEAYVVAAATLLVVLPDRLELDCKITDIDNVILAENVEEAQKLMDMEMGAAPKPEDKIH